MTEAQETLGLIQAAKYTGIPKKQIRSMIEEGELENLGSEKKPKLKKEELNFIKDGQAEEMIEDEISEQRGQVGSNELFGQAEKEEEDSQQPEKPKKRRILNKAAPLDTEGGQLAPEDRYEKWRVDPRVWQPGQTLLQIKLREINSNTFISANPPFSTEMPAFEDLCDMFPDGAILKLWIKGPKNERTGERKTIKGPIQLMIAPKGETQVSGYGNPYSFKNQGGNGQMGNSLDWLKFYQDQNAQYRKDTATNQNTWLQLLAGKKEEKNDNTVLFAMMQENARHAAEMQQNQLRMAQAQSQSNKEMIVGLASALAPIVAAIISKKDDAPDHMITLVTESMKSATSAANKQTEILLTAALGEKDFNKQLELFSKFKDLTDDSALGEIGKFFDASGLAGAVTTLADAGAKRLGGAADSGAPAPQNTLPTPETGGAPAPANPYTQGPPPPSTIDGQQPGQQTAPSHEQQTAAANPGAAAQLKQFLDLFYPAFKGGLPAKDLAGKVWVENKQHKDLFLAYQPDQVVSSVQQYAPMFGYSDLGGADAADYISDFVNEVIRLAKEET